MLLYVSRRELFKKYAELDKIHDPAVYAVDINDQTFYDLTALGAEAAQRLINKAATGKNEEAMPSSHLPITRMERASLKEKIRKGHSEIRRHVAESMSTIVHRTQARNRKSPYMTLDEERAARADVVALQMSAWRKLLPPLIQQFSRIPDPRRACSVKHKVVTLMIFGLMAFVFKLSSRRDMNRELTGTVVIEQLNKIFPELESIPHADTLARLLKRVDPQQIEAAHVELLRKLIRSKKFKKLLINGCLPITIDGAQKLFREGELQDGRWCERNVGHQGEKQQYIYAIEANITLANGLTIPLMTEYLYRENNIILNSKEKQDNETTAFMRIAERLKKYFPRLKIMLCLDAMYATQGVIEIIHTNHWEHMVRLPKEKLKTLAKALHENEDTKKMVPTQSHYRHRLQEFYWKNNVRYDDEDSSLIHLVACLEGYDEVNKKTGEIEKKYSEQCWISSIPLRIDNVYELCNLGARKKELMEDSINTEKNRGYQYKHAFSYNWHAMKGFHYLMRLGHAINALSEFTKKLKKYVQEHGCAATLKYIKDTLFNPWLPSVWYETQCLQAPPWRFQLE